MNKDYPDSTRGIPVPPLTPEVDTSIIGLLRQLSHEVPALFTKELALAKVELQASLNIMKAGIVGVASGALVLVAGFIILLMSAVYGLALFMAQWLAALIVGAVVVIIGFIMLQSGKKQFELSHFTPDRTLNALNKDKEAIQRKVS